MSQDKFQQYMTRAVISNNHAEYFFELREYDQAWQGLKHCLHNLNQALKCGYDEQLMHDFIRLHANYVIFYSAIKDPKYIVEHVDVATVSNEVTSLYNKIHIELQATPTSNITTGELAVSHHNILASVFIR